LIGDIEKKNFLVVLIGDIEKKNPIRFDWGY